MPFLNSFWFRRDTIPLAFYIVLKCLSHSASFNNVSVAAAAANFYLSCDVVQDGLFGPLELVEFIVVYFHESILHRTLSSDIIRCCGSSPQF